MTTNETRKEPRLEGWYWCEVQGWEKTNWRPVFWNGVVWKHHENVVHDSYFVSIDERPITRELPSEEKPNPNDYADKTAYIIDKGVYESGKS